MTIALALLIAQTPPITGERSVVSKCEIAADATYGYSKENPIKVGGTPMYGAARQRRFLQALLGPGGQPIAFRRRGSMAPNDEGVILDLYELTYPGLEKPIELYLDLYRWDPPKAPQGLVCGAPIGLDPPGNAAPPAGPPALPSPPRPTITAPPPPTLSWDRTVALALEWAQKEELAPVPFDEADPTRFGVVFDPFTRIARVARAAARAGTPIAPKLFADIRPVETLIVAFPIECNGRRIEPAGLTVQLAGGRSAGMTTLLTGKDLQRVLPAFDAPEGSVGTMLRSSMVPAAQISVTYERPVCPSNLTTIPYQLRMTMTGRSAPAGPLRWPEGVEGKPGDVVQVTVHGFVDHEGRYHDLKVVEGPEAFHAAALAYAATGSPGVLAVNGVVSRLLRPAGQTIFFRR